MSASQEAANTVSYTDNKDAGAHTSDVSRGVLSSALKGPERRAAERRLLWKVDLLIMVLLSITFGLQYYDKAALGSAAAFGILKDLNLSTVHNGLTSTTRYSTANACFYYGYIVAVLPLSLVLARVNLRFAIGTAVIIWGVIAMLTVVVKDYRGLYAQRFFLGLAESTVSPAFVTVTGLWYKPREQAARFSIWYASTGVFSMFSGAINYGLGAAGGEHAWKNIYYFCGAVTIFWGIVIMLMLPASPLEPGWLFNEAEKELLILRFEENPYARDRLTFKWDQFIEGLTDVRTYLYLFIAAVTYICNGAITAFGTLIIKSIGYTGLQSVALTIPGGAVTVVTIYIFGFPASFKKDIRTYLYPLSCIPVIVGAITIWTAPWQPTAGPLIGYYLVASFGAPYVLLLALASANTAGSTKRAVVNGAIFIGYNVGNIASAYTVRTEEAKHKYKTTWITVIVAMVAGSIAVMILRFILIRLNREKEAAAALAGNSDSDQLGDKRDSQDERVIRSLDEYEDLTDKQMPHFRYSL